MPGRQWTSVCAEEPEGELKEAQAELAKWMQQQQASHKERADVEALQRDCQLLQERLQVAEATSQVQHLLCGLHCGASGCQSTAVL